MAKTRRQPKTQGPAHRDPQPVFVPVHAASMSTPIYAGMAREFGEPDLNPYEWEEITFAQQLIELHAPTATMRQHVPAWALDTGQYVLDRAAYHQWTARMAGHEQGKEADSG